jgi:hypothetical protein
MAGSHPANRVAAHRRTVPGAVAPNQPNADATQAKFVTTGDVRRRDRLLLAAPANTESSIDITVQEAGLLGWIAGAGHVANRRHQPTISIAQSNPAVAERLRRLLDGVPHVVSVDDRDGCGPHRQFGLDHEYAQGLLARAGNPKSDAVAQVLAMSTEQRVGWLDAITDAAGTRVVQRGHPESPVLVCQAPGSVLDAVSLAVYLVGSRPLVQQISRSTRPGSRSPEVGPGSWGPEAAAVRWDNAIITGAFLTKEDAGRGDVWCVTTELGTWTAREDDHIFLLAHGGGYQGY